MSSNDLVKFMTQQVVSYMDQPKEERVNNRAERKATKQPFLFRWFGVIPMAISMFLRKKK
ncbi:YqzE family protein [Alkalihalobacillus sp. R86527]|uniref:YqzE family protein n=1 Tax=Alkalihalobacillus sp. R86527 TaxID=3093863 RepID=UPI00366A8701